MDTQLIKILINSLDRKAFIEFVNRLWLFLDSTDESDFKETKPIPEFDNEIFEQHHYKRYNRKGLYEQQGYNLVIPFFFPLELFQDHKKANLWSSSLKDILHVYKKYIDERSSDWQFWTDGNYITPLISIVTNFINIEKDIYQNLFFPKLEEILNNAEISAEIAIGDCDIFFETNPNETCTTFNQFFIDYQSDISISFCENKINIEYFSSDKYITSGVLKKSKDLCSPIYINNKIIKPSILYEFGELINKHVEEKVLEKFLKDHYKIIFGEHYDRIETQVWLRFPELDINNKNRRLDIFLRNSIEKDWELFELKSIKKLSRTYRDIPVFISEIYTAIQQINNYRKILNQDTVKKKLSLEGIEYYYPEFRLVVGRKPDISTEQWRWLKTSNENNLKILTYDDLLNEMQFRVSTKNKYIIGL